MALITRFEDFLETRLEGLFKRAFPQPLGPSDLARALYKQMLQQRLKSIKYVYVPNYYLLRLHPRDYQSFAPYQSSLLGELAEYLERKAKERNLHLLRPLEIKLDFDREIPLGKIKIFGRLQEISDGPVGYPTNLPPMHDSDNGDTIIYGQIEQLEATEGTGKNKWMLEVIAGVDQGKTFVLPKFRNLLGRQIQGEITLLDPGVSRHHAQLEVLPRHVLLTDLDSTNGTWHQDEPIDNMILLAEDRFRVGDTVLVLREIGDD